MQNDPSPPDPSPVLAELTRVGLTMLRLVERSAATLDPSATPDAVPQIASLCRSFDIIARALRLIEAAQNKQQRPARPGVKPAGKPGEDPEQVEQKRCQQRRALIREVENLIERSVEPDAREAMVRDFYQRLDDPDLDVDLASRGLLDILSEIRADFGLASLVKGQAIFKPRPAAERAVLSARARGANTS